MPGARHDAIVVGGGHNGLVAATLLARAGHSVLVLERSDRLGGAAVSEAPFPGVGARLSRYAYLVSLFPAALRESLGLGVELRPRQFASYTPSGESGLLVGVLDETGSTIGAVADPREFKRWEWFHTILAGVAERVFPTLMEPLRSRDELRELVGAGLWEAIFEHPLSELLEQSFESDVLRGLVLTDATIGTFAAAADPELRQNRCFLYHVIGNGTGRWDVPIGGMGALTGALVEAARTAGAELRTGVEVLSAEADGQRVEVNCTGGGRYRARHLLAGVAPAVLARLLDDRHPEPLPEGSQLKLNMVVSRLPRLRDPVVLPEEAFAGTFHVNESYEQLQRAYTEAAAGHIPTLPPCDVYCHSLTDPSILSPELRASGAHALTVFGLHMPARLFRDDPDATRQAATEATLASIDSVLAEPLEDCLARDPEGAPCLEAHTPLDLEAELGMPGGHIFHRDLAWPFAESDEDVGAWGVETERSNVWLCGAGARRGGGVSGIPGHNAARAVLSALSGLRRSPR